MAPHVLVLNAGSSTLKFALFRQEEGEDWLMRSRGQVESTEGRADIDDVLDRLRSTLQGARLVGIGHRVVHGGVRFVGPTVVTREVLAELHALTPRAPLHQPRTLAPIEAIFERMPDVPQVACFDTAFHRGHSEVARLVPLPREVREEGVERYGFHGISYESIASILPQVAPEIADKRVIVAHLGSGASLCALKNRRSIETTMGFTTLDGLCMGTRPGALDPGVVLYLFQTLGLSTTTVEELLYKQSGLMGISGISNDMRDLLGRSDPESRLAVDYFVYRATKEIGALAAVLEGLDALVFTAGIGENSAEIRRRIGRACAWLGLSLDETANAAHGPRISTPNSTVSAWVIPTNEERMIARHTGSLLGRP
jgi:acetate kinase